MKGVALFISKVKCFQIISNSLSCVRLSVLVDEAAEGADAGVDTGKVRASTARTPGDNTDEGLAGIDERAARVTLARVAATSSDTGANHVGGDGEANSVVVGHASAAGNNGDADLKEGGRGAATLTGSSPSSNGDGGSAGGVRARSGEGSKANVATGGDSAGELPDGNVVVGGACLVAGVDDDAGDADDSATGGGALFRTCVSLSFFFPVDRVLNQMNELTKEPTRTAVLETEPMTLLTEQWAAVTTVLPLMRVPPQTWRPPTWRETMKGYSPAAAVVPPTMFSSGTSSHWGVGAERTSAGSAAASIDWKRMVNDGLCKGSDCWREAMEWFEETSDWMSWLMMITEGRLLDTYRARRRRSSTLQWLCRC